MRAPYPKRKSLERNCIQTYFGGRKMDSKPSKHDATDLPVCPFGHSGIPPILELGGRTLNPRPADYQNQLLYQLRLHQRITTIVIISLTAECATPRHLRLLFGNGRGDRVRTCGILVPNQALYQTGATPRFML